MYPQRHTGRTRSGGKPSFGEPDVSDKPAFIRNMATIPASARQVIVERYRSNLASLLAVDDLVPRVVDALTDAGVSNNTVIIFTSDNGLFYGEHRIRFNKLYAYEEASHLPLYIKGGGFPDNLVAQQLSSNIDLAPTILDLANATAGRVIDGRSLLPLALDPSLATARDLLIESRGYKAVRNRDFLYIRQTNTGERELYDMRAGTANYDPYQLQSRHNSSAYRSNLQNLSTELGILSTCSGTTCQR
jgi:arylsulfatase A-like enzyme